MAKRPTPKKRRSKKRVRQQRSAYMGKQIRRLKGLQNSPYATIAEKKGGGGEVTKIKA